VDRIECDNVSWAPGGKIIFSRDQDVFLSDADGSNQQKLFSAPGPVSHMVFSPDGGRLRFSVGDRKIDQITIWEAQAGGTGLHQILTEMTDFPDRCCGEWSPDGRYYFFETRRNGQNRIWALPERHSWWSRSPAPVASLRFRLTSTWGSWAKAERNCLSPPLIRARNLCATILRLANLFHFYREFQPAMWKRHAMAVC
jgi:WD40 repeat protein